MPKHEMSFSLLGSSPQKEEGEIMHVDDYRKLKTKAHNQVQHAPVDTAHIRACRDAYDKHKAECQDCPAGLCKVGINLLDELCCSITAHRHVEEVTVDESTNPALEEVTVEAILARQRTGENNE